MRPYSPGGALNTFASSENLWEDPQTSAHRLQLGLPGYLIPFATLAFASERQLQNRKPPSPLVFFPVSTHFTATPEIPLPSPELKRYSFAGKPAVELWVFTDDLHPRLHALYTQ